MAKRTKKTIRKKTAKKEAVYSRRIREEERKLNIKFQAKKPKKRTVNFKARVKKQAAARPAIIRTRRPIRRRRKTPAETIRRYFRESVVLTTYYQGNEMFDIRASIVNSKYDNITTLGLLQAAVTREWDKFVKRGQRNKSWSRSAVEAKEGEFVDSDDFDITKEGKVIIDSLQE